MHSPERHQEPPELKDFRHSAQKCRCNAWQM